MRTTKIFAAGTPVVYEPVNSEGLTYERTYGIVKYQNASKTAYVWYHEGCTAANTPSEFLRAVPFNKDHARIHTGCNQCISSLQLSLQYIINRNIKKEKENYYE